MTIQHINPSTIHAPPPGIYTHAVSVTNKILIYISGQVAIDKKGQLVGKGDFEKQANQVFENLKAILESVNADFSNVIKFTMFIVNYQFEHREILQRALKQHVQAAMPPANTLLGIQSLAQPDLLIEIEAVAAID